MPTTGLLCTGGFDPVHGTKSASAVHYQHGYLGRGMHAGVVFGFDPRTNALIGPPLSGKSVVLDAIRFAFGSECDITEIAEISAKRLNKAVGVGGSVRISGLAESNPFQLERTLGGAQTPDPPFLPIMFSQTELVRRGMEPRPSMALLDVHCPTAPAMKTEAADLAEQAIALFQNLAEEADKAQILRERVENPEDGLEAAKSRIESIGGTEDVARQASEIARIRSWRDRTRETVKDWADTLEPPEGPRLESPPGIDEKLVAAPEVFPVNQVDSAMRKYRSDVQARSRELREEIIGILDSSEAKLGALEEELAGALADRGFDEGSAVLEELRDLRGRVESLEADERALREAEDSLGARLVEMRQLIERRSEVASALRSARKEACATVNGSMRSFFARVEEDAFPEELDGLLEEAKTRTYQRAKRMPEVRASLDRFRLLEVAVRSRQGRDELVARAAEMDAQDDIARTAVQGQYSSHLPRIAMMWPEDGLILTQYADQERFENLAEGLRALAIKEISFAANVLPVITDQPEDAVPPQNVYQNLVPTIRRQRDQRQFILASHDANIVVAGDVDSITVLSSGEPPQVGTLFDAAIRDASMEILEGGREAFAIRGRRYAKDGGEGTA